MMILNFVNMNCVDCLCLKVSFNGTQVQDYAYLASSVCKDLSTGVKWSCSKFYGYPR